MNEPFIRVTESELAGYRALCDESSKHQYELGYLVPRLLDEIDLLNRELVSKNNPITTTVTK